MSHLVPYPDQTLSHLPALRRTLVWLSIVSEYFPARSHLAKKNQLAGNNCRSEFVYSPLRMIGIVCDLSFVWEQQISKYLFDNILGG